MTFNYKFNEMWHFPSSVTIGLAIITRWCRYNLNNKSQYHCYAYHTLVCCYRRSRQLRYTVAGHKEMVLCESHKLTGNWAQSYLTIVIPLSTTSLEAATVTLQCTIIFGTRLDCFISLVDKRHTSVTKLLTQQNTWDQFPYNADSLSTLPVHWLISMAWNFGRE